MSSQDYLRQINQLLGQQGCGVVLATAERPWGIEWADSHDPFTGEEQRTWYFTPAEALRAASSLYDPYDASAFSQMREAPAGADGK